MKTSFSQGSLAFDQAAAVLIKMGMNRVILDVDNVILNSRKALAAFALSVADEMNLPPLKLNLKAPRGWQYLGLERDLYEKILHDKRQIAMRKPLIRGVREGFSLLREAGFQIDLLTAVSPSMVATREAHLRDDGLPFCEMLVAPRGASKGPFLEKLAPAIMIDDYPDQVEAALQAGCVGVVFNQRYNEACCAPRLHGWSKPALTDLFNELPAYIEQKRLLVGRGAAASPDHTLSVLQND